MPGYGSDQGWVPAFRGFQSWGPSHSFSLAVGCSSLAPGAGPAPLPGWFLSWADRASYLTNSMPTLERFPISFKTYFSGNYFRHIVLGVNFGGRYGALGMSRREDLMYKPPAFRTLSELVLDYEAAYGRCWHVLRKVKLGQCVSHDPHSVEQIEWKHSVLDVDRLGREDFRKELERHARDMRLKVSVGPRPDHVRQGPPPWCGNGGAAASQWVPPPGNVATLPPSRGGVRSEGNGGWEISRVSLLKRLYC